MLAAEEEEARQTRQQLGSSAATPPTDPLALIAGVNIVLVSRPDTPLKECASALEGLYGVKTRTVAADFRRTDAHGPARVGPVIEGLEVRYPAATAAFG